MAALRQQGKINGDTTLIDTGMLGVHGTNAVYLIQGDRKCLIDAGARTEAPRLIRTLKKLGAFPPDVILLTHPHFDHAQGIPLLREEAGKLGRKIEVLASGDAIPFLADSSFNAVFGRGPHESIRDVAPLTDGDTVDLGGVALTVYDLPGHCQGAIAILDTKNKNIFVGDSIGNKVADDIFLPSFMPPGWDYEAYRRSIGTLKSLSFDSICISHFGCVTGSEAKTILDESVAIFDRWWKFYDKNAGMLNDTAYLLKEMRKEINLGIPDLRPMSPAMTFLLAVMSFAAAVFARKSALVDKLAFSTIVDWLGKGYSMYKASHSGG